MLLDIFLKCYVFIIFLKTTLLRYNLHVLTFICVGYRSPRLLSLYAELHGHHYNLAILHFLCAPQGSLRSLCGHCRSHSCPPPLFWRAGHCALSRPHGETEVSIARKNEAEIWTMSVGTPDVTNLLKLSEEMESPLSRSLDAGGAETHKGIVTFRLRSTERSWGEVSTNSRNASS